MVVKAIVESVVDSYHVKVRIPITDRDKSSNIYTPASDLEIATICTIPNCRPHIKVGDIVFVEMEKTYPTNKPVVLGVLFRENATESYCDLILDDLVVKSSCTLPKGTSIGDISYSEVLKLSGVTDNLQAQLNSLVERISALETINTSTGGNT